MKKKQMGLVAQIYLLVLTAILIIVGITQVSQSQIQKNRVKAQTGAHAAEAAGEVISSIREYPAYEWLFRYWIEHASDMDIEYDVTFTEGTATEEKCILFSQRHPDLQIRYCDSETLKSLPAEDQKLYAEIVYSWLVTRINAIKQNYGCAYLYIVSTDTEEGPDPYGSQLFLMSGADPGAVRGTKYEEVYVLGVQVSVEEKPATREVMKKVVDISRSAEEEDFTERTVGEKIEGAGNYVDYYTCITVSEDDARAYLVGSTYNVKGVRTEIRSSIYKDTLISVLYQILLVNLIVGHILTYFLHPLKKVLESVRSYADTKNSDAVEREFREVLASRKAVAIRRNEVGVLMEDFVAMTKEIDEYTLQIQRAASEKERMAFELETAAQIQLQMLPDGAPEFPDHSEFELCAMMLPAKTVGGDFYDYFLIDEDHLALVMADVSDKGIPAALFMAASKALIKSQAQTGAEPAQILDHVNSQLNENSDGKCFVTVWLAVIDLRTGAGVAANAGHEHPALCRKGASYKLVIYKHSPVVGMIEGISYRQHEFKLNPGDALYVYTDGVPEASNENHEQFGSERMLEALNRNKDKSPGELLAAVSEEIDAFMGGAARFDDTTMMCFHYIGR